MCNSLFSSSSQGLIGRCGTMEDILEACSLEIEDIYNFNYPIIGGQPIFFGHAVQVPKGTMYSTLDDISTLNGSEWKYKGSYQPEYITEGGYKISDGTDIVYNSGFQKFSLRDRLPSVLGGLNIGYGGIGGELILASRGLNITTDGEIRSGHYKVGNGNLEVTSELLGLSNSGGTAGKCFFPVVEVEVDRLSWKSVSWDIV